MKTFLSFLIALSIGSVTNGQAISVDDLFLTTSFSQSKFDNYLSRHGFGFEANDNIGDTLLKKYLYRPTKHFKDNDSIPRSITRAEAYSNTFVSYETTSLQEYNAMKAKLKNDHFYSSTEEAGKQKSFLLYQFKDRSVLACERNEGNVKWYTLKFYVKNFPRPKDIYYADDLLTFSSHEYLAYYFGEKNVKKDIYFFAGNEIAKCSVLFSNTNRQVVFIWADEENRCTVSNVLFGGQQNLQSSIESGRFVAQNNWALRNGVRPGMSLLELRMLNGNDFKFYGGNSINSGSLIPNDMGKIDFAKQEIILGCLDCRDDKFTNSTMVNADDCIEEGKHFFVLSIILNPF